MKAVVIKTKGIENKGFDRVWELVKECKTKSQAKDIMVEESLKLKGVENVKGRAYDPDKNEFIFTNDDDEFRYNDYIYKIVTAQEIREGLFKGGVYGYTPSFVGELFPVKDL